MSWIGNAIDARLSVWFHHGYIASKLSLSNSTVDVKRATSALAACERVYHNDEVSEDGNLDWLVSSLSKDTDFYFSHKFARVADGLL